MIIFSPESKMNEAKRYFANFAEFKRLETKQDNLFKSLRSFHYSKVEKRLKRELVKVNKVFLPLQKAYYNGTLGIL